MTMSPYVKSMGELADAKAMDADLLSPTTTSVYSEYRPLDPPTRADWECFKDPIIHKYVGMNLPLREIVRQMEYWHGFKASQRMYKQRFTEWGVFKYRKAAEKRLAKARLTYIQPGHDAKSIPMSRGQSTTTSVSTNTSNGFDDNAEMTEEDADESTCNQSAVCAHRYCIQKFLLQLQNHYASVARSQRLPETLLLDTMPYRGSVERVLYYVRHFSESWMMPEANTHQHHIVDAAAKAARITSGIVGHCSHKSSPKQCERCTWSEFDFGLAMLEEDRPDAAMTSFELGCRLAHLLLSSPSKLFIRNLIMAFGSTRWQKHKQFRHKLLEYLALMASVVLGERHPITIILIDVSCGETLVESAEFALKSMIQVFERATHAAHPDVLLIKRSLSVILRRQQDYVVSEQILQSAIVDSTRHNGYDCKETRRCLRRLGHLYMEQKRFGEAEAVYQRILDTAPGKAEYQENWIPDEISCYTYQHLADLSDVTGHQQNCRYWFMKELSAAIKRWGVGAEYTAQCLQVAYNSLSPEALRSAVNQYPDIFEQAEMRNLTGEVVISKARWCAVRNLI
jgi:tetratricopeptide (TPR) repeat protein